MSRPSVAQALCLIGLFVTGALLFTYTVWPLLLWPFADVLIRSPLAGLLGLIPCLLVGARQADAAAGASPHRSSPMLSSRLDALLLGSVIGTLHILVQIILIKRKTHLTLAQYMREDIHILWLAMIPLGIGYALLLHCWGRRRS